jgi:hypothetical protein
MADINKWASVFTVIIAIVTWNAWSFIDYLWEHL